MDQPDVVTTEVYDTGNRRRRNRMLLYFGIVTVIVAISIGTYFAVDNKKDDGNKTAQSEALLRELSSVMTSKGLDASRLSVSTSYQAKAMQWVLDTDKLILEDKATLLQRFTLACLYYATNDVITLYTDTAVSWRDSKGWLSADSECTWLGVQCSSKGNVNGITLESNSMTGALPKELMILADHITSLSFTSNLLYMVGDDFDVFDKLPRLETLLIDDNYMSTTDGLPSSFKSLVSLKKLRMSYNLLGGELSNDMVKSWPKLTHLEIESNFLSGSLPSALGHMDQLIYLYMRRNSITSNLDFLKTGKMENLFAMWLDNNLITGGIPTEIGALTILASISITNATLTGTIPTEMGKLTNLRRLWLYQNDLKGSIPTQLAKLTGLEVFEIQNNSKLTGTVPAEICASVKASTFVDKSLTATCSNVDCANCCTVCA